MTQQTATENSYEQYFAVGNLMHPAIINQALIEAGLPTELI